MNPEQIPQLIAQIALADPRVRREDPTERRAQIYMWAGILTDVPYDYAITAAHKHYAESQWPILPANIATRWAADVRDRMNRHTQTFEPTAHPELDPDDVHGYHQALRRDLHAVATGQAQPVAYKQLTDGTREQRERLAADRLTELGTYMPQTVAQQLAPLRPRRAAREHLARTGQPDPLNVVCTWCNAPAGEPCRGRRINPRDQSVTNRPRNKPHPSRVDDAARAQARQASA